MLRRGPLELEPLQLGAVACARRVAGGSAEVLEAVLDLLERRVVQQVARRVLRDVSGPARSLGGAGVEVDEAAERRARASSSRRRSGRSRPSRRRGRTPPRRRRGPAWYPSRLLACVEPWPPDRPGRSPAAARPARGEKPRHGSQGPRGRAAAAASTSIAPARIATMRSATSNRRSVRCSATTMAMPWRSRRSISVRISSSAAAGSSWLVGSSRSSTRGPIARTEAIATRWRSPPDSVCVVRSARCAAPTISSAARGAGMDLAGGDAEVLEPEGGLGEHVAA